MGMLDGQVAFITGAARGQGRQHALALAREGADIAVFDIVEPIGSIPYPLASAGDLADTVRQVEAFDRRCVGIEGDVRSKGDLDGAVARVISELGHIDILVSNAGVLSFGAFSEITDAMWNDVISTNLTGAFNAMRAVVPHMMGRKRGRIVAISSMSGRFGAPNMAHYSASKWGVIGLVKTLALEVATQGITVNAVCSTTVETTMVKNDVVYRTFAPGVEDPTEADIIPRYEALNPMSAAWVPAEDVSQAVVYLCGDHAQYISGTTLNVCAGVSARMP